LTLKKKELINDLTDFEGDVYVHFGRFSRTKPLKPGAERPYLPLASFFFNLNSVKRIIQTTSNVKDEATCSKKWSKFDNSKEKTSKKKKAKVVKKKAPTKKKTLASQAKVVKKKALAKVKTLVKKAKAAKKKASAKGKSASLVVRASTRIKANAGVNYAELN
jgi:LAS superfamily LD-carboxypeptidase LdcB